jgi:hypothetical protein
MVQFCLCSSNPMLLLCCWTSITIVVIVVELDYLCDTDAICLLGLLLFPCFNSCEYVCM